LDARSLSMLITEASVNHDRPGARIGKVGKLVRSLARDDVGRGIKAVINYAITRSYLKIKTVFLASMRLTDDSCHRLLRRPSPRLSGFSRSTFRLCRFPNGESFGFLRWLCEGCASSSSFFYLSLSHAHRPIPFLLDLRSPSLLAISWAACRSFCYTRFPRHP